MSQPLLVHHCSSRLYFFAGMNRDLQKGGVLLTSQRFKEDHWRPLIAFPLQILDIVSSSRSCAGIVAYSHRGSTLKVTKLADLYKYLN